MLIYHRTYKFRIENKIKLGSVHLLRGIFNHFRTPPPLPFPTQIANSKLQIPNCSLPSPFQPPTHQPPIHMDAPLIISQIFPFPTPTPFNFSKNKSNRWSRHLERIACNSVNHLFALIDRENIKKPDKQIERAR